MKTCFDLQTLWKRLAEIKSLRFVAQSFDSGSGWNGTGKGSVEVESVDPVTMLYHETGRWLPREGTELPLTSQKPLVSERFFKMERFIFMRVDTHPRIPGIFR
ncbi:MAG: hypothetical protein KDA77_00355 [Planctomycetaceae bacterium]|nr:hypothetical protein [Planctomycetaceae bacterium]